MNVFYPEYIVLFLILTAAGGKMLKKFWTDGRKRDQPVKGKIARK